METIQIKPAVLFASLKIVPFLMVSFGLVWLSWLYWPGLLWLAAAAATFAFYRYLYIRRITYIITTEYLQVSRGLCFRRTDTIELFRIKDYVLEQPLLLQILRLMDLQLLTTDPVNPVVWLRGIPRSDLVETLRERVLETRRYNRVYEFN